MSKVHVFVSFDLEHDRDLHDLLLEQSSVPTLGFEVSARSESRAVTDLAGERVRRRIREADQVIIICGEHTDESMAVGAELRIAREEKTPYFLLWGRRDSMCSKPATAKPADGMYSWTSEILQNQIVMTLRNARWDAKAAGRSEAAQKG